MKAEEKRQIIIDLSARAAVAALERRAASTIPFRGLPSSDLFPMISRRVGWMMEDSNDTIYEDEAIPPPDEKFLRQYWKFIKPHAAEKYQKFIIPDTDGFRLGTLEEYCTITTKQDMPIVLGIGRSARRRSQIAQKLGASSPTIDAKLKELPSGE